MIHVVNKRKHNGPGEYIGRPTPLGNPFSHKHTGTLAEFVVKSRDEAVDRYEDWLRVQLADPASKASKQFSDLLTSYRETGELYLVCWCAPARCHGDIIKELLMEVLNDISKH